MSAGALRLTYIGGPTAAARAFGDALIIPLHFEGWAHFSESRDDLDQAFAAAGLSARLRWPVPGQPLSLPCG
ncbi:MAG TPA: hypothetical protein VFG66_13015 [Gemmatimonadales bacterium]|nr:hypothetical protein [Gemmatimonadales bacterium]